MRRALALLLVVGLAGCGSSSPAVHPTGGATRTVTVTEPAPAPPTASTPIVTTPRPATPTGPAPSPIGDPRENALASLGDRGFAAVDPTQYEENHLLKVLVGHRSGADGAHAQKAFFFVGARYIGTDTVAPSGDITIERQEDRMTTLSYGLYRPGDPACCPGAGRARVRFRWTGSRLVALDAIPPAATDATPGRR